MQLTNKILLALMVKAKSKCLTDYKARNRIAKVEVTIARRLNQTSYPENGLSSFSGVFFWFFFAQAKKNRIYYRN
jgi:hypothetical protein